METPTGTSTTMRRAVVRRERGRGVAIGTTTTTRARWSRRGELQRAHGLVKPRGMTDAEYEQMLRQQDEQYKLFSEKAKKRIAKRGPMEGDVKGTSDYVSTQSLGAPVDVEPTWSKYAEMTLQEFVSAVDKGQVKTFQVWDAPEFGWFPPKVETNQKKVETNRLVSTFCLVGFHLLDI